MRPLLIAERIKFLKKEINKACTDCGRNDEVRLVAVAKKQPVEAVTQALDQVLDIGENYAQELMDKFLTINREDVRWHFIGNLQTNKAKYVAQAAYMLHTLHSVSLAKELDKNCKMLDKKLKVLIQVNVSNEATKSGVPLQAAYELAKQVIDFNNLELCGFMAIPNPNSSELDTKKYFQKMQELKNGSQDKIGILLPELSMGMSHDFRLAIEYGATIIRVGTAIFGERNYTK